MDEDKPDIEVGSLAAGCFSSLGFGCLSTLIILGLLAATGVELTRLTPQDVPDWLKFLGFLIGLAGEVLGGYVAARYASQAKKFHALILGIIGMLVGVLAFVLPSHSPVDFASVVAWLLSIPMSLWGAGIAIAQEENKM